MDKKNIDSHDRLWEELTLTRIGRDAESPPYGGWGGGHTNARWLGHTWNTKGIDFVYVNNKGQLHRTYGPAYVSTAFKVEKWYQEDKLHRIGGPALRHKDTLMWYKEGRLHNLEGPAVIDPGGPKQYWIEGHKMTEKEWKKAIASKKRKGLLK